eukprot:TRINITY_DN1570_c0_g3_i1.p1 TRINITY_DN1570_c0_g3~~TRINITY_DN1570_c0_g3_i1.p1  ORF type:complete len:112 (-),score=6.48 TRINITY_DN1570_c0_g3_i1:182-517(-)
MWCYASLRATLNAYLDAFMWRDHQTVSTSHSPYTVAISLSDTDTKTTQGNIVQGRVCEATSSWWHQDKTKGGVCTFFVARTTYHWFVVSIWSFWLVFCAPHTDGRATDLGS